MTDRPIIFSAAMIKALIAGRKTQTRRIIKIAGRGPDYVGPRGCTDDPRCWGWEDSDHGDYVTIEREPGQRMGWRDWRGAYRVGDRLWVREAHRCNGWATDLATVFYRASEGDGYTAMCEQWPIADHKPLPVSMQWRPSIHMPRWASRLTLIVTDVRVQRLQNISEDDARAEGLTQAYEGWATDPEGRCYGDTAKSSFTQLWDSLHGDEAWSANPWVAAINFTVLKGNIDSFGVEQ